MGQPITVQAQVIGDVALFDTNRSITGQDGGGFGSALEAVAGDGLGAALATRLFAADAGITHVFVHSNSVSVQRAGGWAQHQVDAAGSVISRFFVFYRDEA